MKNYLIGILVVALAVFGSLPMTVSAQSSALNKGDFFVNPSLSFGNFGGYYSPVNRYDPNRGFATSVMVSGKLMLHEYISAGPFVGFGWNSFDSPFFDENDHMVSIAFGGKGSFHYWKIVDEMVDHTDLMHEVLDLYVNLYVGLEVQTVTYATIDGDETDSDIDGIFQPNLGIRYFINENIAFFSELGPNGMGYFKLGATFTL